MGGPVVTRTSASTERDGGTRLTPPFEELRDDHPPSTVPYRWTCRLTPASRGRAVPPAIAPMPPARADPSMPPAVGLILCLRCHSKVVRFRTERAREWRALRV
jgi:hypothetical protein